MRRPEVRRGLAPLLAAALAACALAAGPAPDRAVHVAAGTSTAEGALAAVRKAIAEQAWPRAESLATSGLAHSHTGADSAEWIAHLVLARWRNDHEKLPGTLAVAERALALRLAAPGADSIPLAVAYERHAYALSGAGRSRESDERALAALGIRTRHARGPDADIIRLQHLLGVFAYQRTEYARAITFFSAEVDAREAFVPRDPVELARANMSLASAQSVTGERAAALAHYERALELLDAAPVASDRDRLYALNSLVIVLGTSDRLAEAVELAHHAVELAERSLGPDHPQTGYAHRSLGYAYSALGDFASAREEETRALDVLTHAYGDSSDQVAQTRRMLAVSANKSGDFETALPIALEVLRVLEAARVPDATLIVDAISSVAFALNGLGRREEAMERYRQALAWCDRSLGPRHPRTSFQMANLAGQCLELGQLARAESLLVRGRELAAAREGPRHSTAVQFLRGLAIVAATRRQWPRADSLAGEAVAIARQTGAGNSQDLAPALLDRARVRAEAGQAEAAVADALEAASFHRAQQRLMADGLSEREALRFAAADPSGLPIAVSIAAEAQLAPRTRRAVWDAVVRARARVADDMAERLHLAASPVSDSLAAAFRRASADLAASLVRGAPAARVDSLGRVRERLEVALGRASARWGIDREDARRGFEDVRAALPEGAALVAYVRHPRGHAADAVGRVSPVPGYTAFVLPAAGDDPLVVSLGDAGVIDSLVAEWNALAGRPLPAEPAAARRAEARLRRAGDRLRERAWDPVRARVAGASIALVVPDGALQLVNLGTLPDGRGWLIERSPTLHALTAERDVVRGAGEPVGAGLLAFGAPDFDGRAGTSPDPAFRGARPRCSRFEAVTFPPLPGSRAEMDTVVALWRRSSLSGEPSAAVAGGDANETRFKHESAGHRVLHLATHGFYLDATCFAEAGGGRGVTGLADWSPPAPAKARRRPSQAVPGTGRSSGNPLMLGGLVLTGANHRNDAAPGDDGVLTAQEIAALDLRGTEWAVLSSCRSGVGEVQDGEGVSGLRRAFRQAGVRTVISSLWPVGDEDARAWMEAFYRQRFASGVSTATAVREASLARLRALRDRRRPTPPIAWGAFLASGDWR